jgi:glutathione S-transferase
MQIAFGLSSIGLGQSRGRVIFRHSSVQRIAMSGSSGDPESSAMTLVSVPVSGYAMRVRFIASKKGLGPEVMQLKAPAEFGGLKSEQFLAVNPLGKMPALFIHKPPDVTPKVIFESRVIADYIIDRFADVKPSFVSSSPERRAVGNLVASICDNYIAHLQPYMYKPCDADVDRDAKIQEMGTAFDAIELVLDPNGPYVSGADISVGDAALLGK